MLEYFDLILNFYYGYALIMICMTHKVLNLCTSLSVK